MKLLSILPAPLQERTTAANLVAVSMDSAAVSYLQQHAWADLHKLLFRQQRSPFSVSQLIEIASLLPLEPANVVMTPQQSLLLFTYVTQYYKLAIRKGKTDLGQLYSDFMDHLLPGTLISFQL